MGRQRASQKKRRCIVRKYEAEVAKGIALLDEKQPGWRERINLSALDMGHCGQCILGQVFGDYEIGVNHFFAIGSHSLPKIHGFLSGAWQDSDWQDLRDEWRCQLGMETVLWPRKRNILVKQKSVQKSLASQGPRQVKKSVLS